MKKQELQIVPRAFPIGYMKQMLPPNPKGASSTGTGAHTAWKIPLLGNVNESKQLSEQCDTASGLSGSEQGAGLDIPRVSFPSKLSCDSMIPHNMCSNGVDGASSSIPELWGLLSSQD